MDTPATASGQFARNKQELLMAVQEAFGWDRLETIAPHELQRMRSHLRAPWTSVHEDFLRDPPTFSQLQRTHKRIFGEKKMNGSRNLSRVKEADPEILGIVEAMFDQYVQCLHWDRMAQAQQLDKLHGEREPAYTRQQHAIEAVRAQIAPHYAQLLMERGYSEEDTVKIIGNAIYAFTETAFIADRQTVAVHPEKATGKKPGTIIHEINDYADAMKSRAEHDRTNNR